jgi:hypothetical protein
MPYGKPYSKGEKKAMAKGGNPFGKKAQGKSAPIQKALRSGRR